MIDKEVAFETFFKKCKLNPNAHLITGTICGYRIEDLESPLIKQARFMDKLVDELAKGRKMKKCCAPKQFNRLFALRRSYAGDQNAVIPMEKVNALERVINLKREMIEVREVELCVAAK